MAAVVRHELCMRADFLFCSLSCYVVVPHQPYCFAGSLGIAVRGQAVMPESSSLVASLSRIEYSFLAGSLDVAVRGEARILGSSSLAASLSVSTVPFSLHSWALPCGDKLLRRGCATYYLIVFLSCFLAFRSPRCSTCPRCACTRWPLSTQCSTGMRAPSLV